MELGTWPESVDSNIWRRNVHTGPRKGRGPGAIASYCVSPIPYTIPGPSPVQDEEAIRRENRRKY